MSEYSICYVKGLYHSLSIYNLSTDESFHLRLTDEDMKALIDAITQIKEGKNPTTEDFL